MFLFLSFFFRIFSSSFVFFSSFFSFFTFFYPAFLPFLPSFPSFHHLSHYISFISLFPFVVLSFFYLSPILCFSVFLFLFLLFSTYFLYVPSLTFCLVQIDDSTCVSKTDFFRRLPVRCERSQTEVSILLFAKISLQEYRYKRISVDAIVQGPKL